MNEQNANMKIMAKLMLRLLPIQVLLAAVGSVNGIVSSFFATNYVGVAAMSAVGLFGPVGMLVTSLATMLAGGSVILCGKYMGQNQQGKLQNVFSLNLLLSALIAAVFTLVIPLMRNQLSAVMHAPKEAFSQTAAYICICGIGSAFIIAYNLIGSIFRGIGDSGTPLMTVIIACAFNVAGDLLLVAVFHMGTVGAALATVFAQALSVFISLIILRRKELPFEFHPSDIRLNRPVIRKVTTLGLPIALQDLLVGISFLVLQAIVNSLGLTASASIGVAEKVCGFIMLIPAAFMQAMAAFSAQNIGAGKYRRARQALLYAIGVSTALAVVMFAVTFWRGDLMASVFTNDPAVIAAAADYLKAYAIDCLLTCFLFCFIGFFNGLGMTRFVMIQGIIGAFLVRIPVAFLMSKEVPVSMFHIGLATPCSTVLQVIMCLVCFWITDRKYKNRLDNEVSAV